MRRNRYSFIKLTHRLSAAILCALTLRTAGAHAAEPVLSPPHAASRDSDAAAAMERGIAAYSRGEVDHALREYEQAKLLAPAANVPYRYAAVAYAALGRYREAVENLQTYLAKKPGVSDADAVKAQIKTLTEEHLPASVAVQPASLRVSVSTDGGVASNTAHVLQLPPGEHVFFARTERGDAERRVVRTIGGTNIQLRFEVREKTLTLAPGTADSAQRNIGRVLTITGSAALVSALVLDIAVLGSKLRTFNEAASAGSGNLVELQQSARSWQTGVGITYVAGGVVALTGIVLWLLAPSSRRTSQSAQAPTAGSAGGVAWRF
jgi:tetratricopeptide (TPR) repeat protein